MDALLLSPADITRSKKSKKNRVKIAGTIGYYVWLSMDFGPNVNV
jgi:hypothetical protein